MNQNDRVEARRQKLLAMLRESDRPLTTSELHAGVGEEIVEIEWCPLRQMQTWQRERVRDHTHATVVWTELVAQTNVYANLRQLEAKHQIQRVHFPESRSVYWRAVLSADEADKVNQEIEALEKLLEQS